ncbi:MAG: hydrogenase maturation nickel metallochaperone HypA, partial [Verrucomicrobiota bacterium]|nr:hydrogenase maturation nickel metallochaperone HypA [Verrucomicrobiota bacterium]
LVKKNIPLVKDAALDLTEVEPLLICLKCDHKFRGNHLPDICPGCASVEVQAVNSTDMALEGFEMES